MIPEPIRGRRLAHVRIAAVGGDDAVDLAPLRAVTPVLDTVPAFLTGGHALDVAFNADDQAWLSRVKQAWDPA